MSIALRIRCGKRWHLNRTFCATTYPKTGETSVIGDAAHKDVIAASTERHQLQIGRPRPGQQTLQDSIIEKQNVEESKRPSMLDWNNTSSMANDQLEHHREIREYYRKIAWELPQLAAWAVPSKKPVKKDTIEFKYVSYLGEDHPANSKIVLTVDTKLLNLDDESRHSLHVLAGTRYNQETGILRMSCNEFPNPLQNKRYLVQTLEKLISKSKEKLFVDVPLLKQKPEPKGRIRNRLRIPDEWIKASRALNESLTSNKSEVESL